MQKARRHHFHKVHKLCPAHNCNVEATTKVLGMHSTKADGDFSRYMNQSGVGTSPTTIPCGNPATSISTSPTNCHPPNAYNITATKAVSRMPSSQASDFQMTPFRLAVIISEHGKLGHPYGTCTHLHGTVAYSG